MFFDSVCGGGDAPATAGEAPALPGDATVICDSGNLQELPERRIGGWDENADGREINDEERPEQYARSAA